MEKTIAQKIKDHGTFAFHCLGRRLTNKEAINQKKFVIQALGLVKSKSTYVELGKEISERVIGDLFQSMKEFFTNPTSDQFIQITDSKRDFKMSLLKTCEVSKSISKSIFRRLNNSICYTNSQSLDSNLSKLKRFCLNFKPKILFLSETRTVKGMTDNELKLENYNLLRCDAKNRHTGGVAVYVHNSIAAHVVQKSRINSVWTMTVEVTGESVQGRFSVVYKGHEANNEDFLRQFKHLCDEYADENENSVIVGDFNIDLWKISQDLWHNNDFIKVAKKYNLEQLVKSPTREKIDKETGFLTRTLIDWCFCNRTNAFVDVIKDEKWQIADHFILNLNGLIDGEPKTRRNTYDGLHPCLKDI